jgi:hypothetical protein
MNYSLDPHNPLSFLSLKNFMPECLRRTPVFSITYGSPSPVTTCVPYHLRDFIKLPQKSPNVSYHLQTLKPVSTCVPYHLQETPGWGASVPEFLRMRNLASRDSLRDPVTPFVMYHLRVFSKMPQKSPSVFYHLQTLKPVSTFVMYHLQKTRGGGSGTATLGCAG